MISAALCVPNGRRAVTTADLHRISCDCIFVYNTEKKRSTFHSNSKIKFLPTVNTQSHRSHCSGWEKTIKIFRGHHACLRSHAIQFFIIKLCTVSRYFSFGIRKTSECLITSLITYYSLLMIPASQYKPKHPRYPG